MGDFKDRVMASLRVDNGDVGGDADEDAPTSPCAVPANGGQAIPARTGPEELQPAGPGTDDLGGALVPYTCCKCGIVDHMPEALAEVHHRRRIQCLPCRAPERWRWRVNRDEGGVFLDPRPGQKQSRKKLGEDERRALENQATAMIDLKERREYLRAAIFKMQAELAELEPRLAALVLVEVPAAQAAVVAIEQDPALEKRQRAFDLAHDISLAINAVAKTHRKNRKVIQR